MEIFYIEISPIVPENSNIYFYERKIFKNKLYSMATFNTTFNLINECLEKKKDYFTCIKCLYKKKETDVSDETFKTYNIGVFLPADQELNEIPFFQQCLMGICETAASKLYEVLVIMLEANDLSRV